MIYLSCSFKWSTGIFHNNDLADSPCSSHRFNEEEIMQLPDTDDEGYLVDPSTWTEEIANEFASQENIQLTADHWDAIGFMRKWYDESQVAPDVRHVMKHLAERLGPGSRNIIFELFPYGYVKQACRIAGMKRPRGWSTG
jgi:TusE/DsrC/DsvC family sulfur relay protein